MPIITEQAIKINVSLPKSAVNAKMDVFYNPMMKSNRNISILLLNCIKNKEMKIADTLAGSGIRSLRFLQELKKNKIASLRVNDFKDNFKKTFLENSKLNNLKIKKHNLKIKKQILTLHQEEASLFLLHQNGFDYIEIDPFGSPNPFLAAAIARISREGILAVTATDTAALTGTYPAATKRKYWANSLKNYLMHETGLRILIRKVQLQGIQFDKALFPILAYHKDHYFRVYFLSEKGKEKCDEIIPQLQYFLWCPQCLNFKTSHFNKETCLCGNEFLFAGPLWIGKLLDSVLLQKMKKNNLYPEEQKFLDILAEESKIDAVGFYDLHEFASLLKKEPPRIEVLLKQLGESAVRTHFSPTGIKTKAKLEEIKKAFLS